MVMIVLQRSRLHLPCESFRNKCATENEATCYISPVIVCRNKRATEDEATCYISPVIVCRNKSATEDVSTFDRNVL